MPRAFLFSNAALALLPGNRAVQASNAHARGEAHMSSLERRQYGGAVSRQLKGALSALDAERVLAEHKMSAQRQVAQHGVAQTLRLRDWLRVIEQHNPDAAPAAAVFVRMAEGGMIAAALEFEAGL